MAGNTSSSEPIAIVGSSCRFPGGASSPSKLWELLKSPHDLSAEIPPSRFNVKGFYDTDGERAGCTNASRAYLIEEDYHKFDASFFNINPREAEAIDPQQKFLLETVYESIESSGYAINQLQGSKTAVYVGLMTADFNELMLRDVDRLPKYYATGTARSIISNRISYFFDWKGPSMTIDTACSSSLVAVHQAVQTLRSGQCNLAVAAGANLILSPDMMISESKLHMLSPTGYSRMWDDRADGYARGEGFASIVLKPLSHAIRDGDHIECVIRETGVNQDGRTRGITMPSAESQVALIQDTYERAGLDYRQETGRCQYFEAHGTGTPAGDPIEAEAIHNSFFQSETPEIPSEKLYVGSVKTVIGHLEGCAGLAGLLKTSLALQHGIIPPNLHFKSLNPAIEKYYGQVEVPVDAVPWPATSGASVRRASVNSFGFGGTNAHIIVESFSDDSRKQYRQALETNLPNVTPITITANSHRSLTDNIKALSTFIESCPDADINQLAFNLRKRSQLPIRLSLSSLTREDLITQLAAVTASVTANPTLKVGRRTTAQPGSNRILGIFTGQGAQWPQMGRELLLSSEVFASTINKLENSLTELEDGPTWSLVQEMGADPSTSRVGEAQISQPLCTAVQVALVDLLTLCGIEFDYVVGHSSGEIAAAYAAGYLSAWDAIRIAYYRGVHSVLAGGKDGCNGSMMAVGLPYEQGREFCSRPQFEGTISVAASNAPSSVTFSGDESTLKLAKAILDEEGIFARILRVDKAYHSHHMTPCGDPYIQSLRNCQISVRCPKKSCTWVSSVDCRVFGANMDLSGLSDTYWRDNLTNTVLFSQAIETLMMQDPLLDIALEVGPHPALKGPVAQNMKALSSAILPYTGLLERSHNDVEAFSKALGLISDCIGWSSINFTAYAKSFPCLDSARFSEPLRLPSYAWDHDQTYWKEPRSSKAYRSRDAPKHCLLGSQSIENISHDLRWRSILRLDELPWLRGHKVEGQVVFPAAGYLVMALEASKALYAGRTPLRLELEDVSLFNAMLLEEGSDGTEILFTMKSAPSKNSEGAKSSEFVIYSCIDSQTNAWERHACGHIRVVFENSDALPPSSCSSDNPVPGLTAVNVDSFYAALDKIGLNYSDDFRGMNAIKRRLGFATAEASAPVDDTKENFIIHPALLDLTFQVIFAAFCWPGDSSLSAPYVPTHISKIVLDMDTWSTANSRPTTVDIDAFLTESSSMSLSADLEIVAKGSGTVALQVQQLTATNLRPADISSDREIFTETVWDMDVSGGPVSQDFQHGLSSDSVEDLELVDFCERLSYYYLRNLRKEVHPQEVKSFEWHYQRLFEFTDFLFPKIEGGRHSTVRPEWANDTWADLASQFEKVKGQIDVDLISAVGRNLPKIVRGEIPALEVMVENDMLNRIYSTGLGFEKSNQCLSSIAKRITHRYARTNILEIGAGTGGATSVVLKGLQNKFASYTFTDISAGFFEHAQERFSAYDDKMVYKTLDIERAPEEQGYEEGAYDIIIASNVLHATSTLQHTMSNVRKLLKPGGYLLLLEITSDILRVKLMMSGLPGWWLGGGDGRRYAPTITQEQWDCVLKQTGFSGVDVALHDFKDTSRHMTSVLACQAIDNGMQLLRNPLSVPWSSRERLLVVGGTTENAIKLTDDMKNSLQNVRPDIPVIHVQSLEDLDVSLLSSTPLVICAEELDRPCFDNLDAAALKNLQRFFNEAKNVLWLLPKGDPYTAMTIGLARSLRHEMPQLHLQVLGISPQELSSGAIDANKVIGLALRLSLSGQLSDNIPRLWTSEPELVLENNKIWIPRILASSEKNDRTNASRRNIQREIEPTKSTIQVVRKQGSFDLVLPPPQLGTSPASREVRLNVSFSTLQPVVVDGLHLHLVYGVVADVGTHVKGLKTGDQVVAGSATNSNVVTVGDTCAVKCSWTDLRSAPARTLYFLSSLIITENIRASLNQKLARCRRQKHAVLVNEATHLLRYLLLQGGNDDITYIWTTSDPKAHSDDVPYVGYTMSRSQTEHLRKLRPSALLDLSGKLIDCPASLRTQHTACQFMNQSHFLGGPPDINGALSDNLPSNEPLRNALSCIDFEIFQLVDFTPSVTGIGELRHCSISPDLLSVLDWTKSLPLSVQVHPLNPNSIFRDDVTYLLVGCLGGLGISISRYMVSNGARHLALCGRDPSRVDSQLLDELRSMGATVNTYAMDVSDRARVSAVYTEICNTMPRIAGVANAAMVLNDCMFKDMEFSDMTRVLGPKVQGTKNLAELFPSNTLDFFLVFSSTASIVGNRGQSNYSAANLFMAELMRERRRQGLAGSTIDIGMILGVGYITQTGVFEKQLSRYNFMTMSENEIHTIFMEGILSGKPGTAGSCEIITGLDRSDPTVGLDENPFWSSDPRFSHHVMDNTPTSSGTPGQVSVPVKQMLEAASGEDEALKLVEDAFIAKLSRITQLAPDSIDPCQPLVQLGVDSLMAVEIRTWFLNELGMDFAVLKILGGASAREACKTVLAGKTFSAPVSDVATPLPVSTNPNPPILKVEEADTEGTSEPPCDSGMVRSTTPLSRLSKSDSKSTFTSESGQITETSSWPPSLPSTPEVLSPRLAATEPDEKTTALYPRYDFVEQASYAQERIWFLHEYLSDSTSFNVTLSYAFKGPLRPVELASAFRLVAERHESLRTAFFLDHIDGSPQLFQGILPKSQVEISIENIADIGAVDTLYTSIKRNVYDLENGKTMKAAIASLSPTDHFLILGFHHIVLDGFSAQILIKDLQSIYACGRVLPPAPRYRDFTALQRQMVQEGRMNTSLEFWKTELADMPSTLPLFPFSRAHSRKTLDRYSIHSVHQKLGAPLASKVREVARNEGGSTSFFLYLTLLRELVFRLSGQTDICIGISDAARSDKEALQTIGMFVNMIPLRFRASQPDQSFHDVLTSTSKHVRNALEHSKVPFQALLDELSVKRSPSENPLFQILLNYKMGSTDSATFGNCTAERLHLDDARVGQDIVVEVEEFTDGDCLLSVKGQDYLYSTDSLNMMMSSMIAMLRSVASNPGALMSDIEIIDPIQISHALNIGRGSRVYPDRGQTVIHQFEEHCHVSPDTIAVKQGDGQFLTYGQVQSLAHTIADNLRSLGNTVGMRVAVACKPSLDSVIAVLGIHYAGAIYVPLDIEHPKQRLQTVMADCEAGAIICHDATSEIATSISTASITIVNVSDLSPTNREHNIEATFDSPAYILYTSGSTGKPKGVIVSHGNLACQMLSMRRDAGLSNEIVLHQSSVAFDASIDCIYAALANKGTVVIVPHEIRRDPIQLAHVIAKEKVTYTQMTSSEYQNLLVYASEYLKGCGSWKNAFCGGERFLPSLRPLFEALSVSSLRVWNRYGPTEATVSSNMDVVIGKGSSHTTDKIPCGQPMTNYSVFILDERMKPVPIGYPGEICIGGGGVAQGYLNHPDLTAKSFVRDLNATGSDISFGWDRLYRTGDRGYMLVDGSLIYTGRMEGSSQTKIRGNRVELDEIENAILKASSGTIVSAGVCVKGENEGAFIAAYVVVNQDVSLNNVSSLFKDLASTLPLPRYMRPSSFAVVEELPQTTSGKLDRQKLATMNGTRFDTDSGEEAPLSDSEKVMAAAWGQLLPGIPSLSSDSDFFEVGGNSLLLVKLQKHLEKSKGISISLGELFSSPILSDMAQLLSTQKGQILVENASIDWDREIQITEDIRTVPRFSQKIGNKREMQVLLTGATGFLGGELLQQLLQNSRVSQVHCVAVRQTSSGAAHLSSLSPKVIPYYGDLSKPDLGLSEAQLLHLSETIDVVIHNGAEVSFLKSYHSLRKSNVDSTKTLARLALHRGIPFHFVSTGGVANLTRASACGPGSVKDFIPPSDGSHGYIASKWASECFLERVAKELHLPVWIHRPASITGQGAPPADIMQNVLQYATKMQLFPAVGEVNWQFDFIPVETVAGELLKTAVDAENHTHFVTSLSGCTYLHHCNPIKLTPIELKQQLECQSSTGGRGFREVSVADWVLQAKAHGLDDLIASTFIDLVEHQHDAVFTALLTE